VAKILRVIPFGAGIGCQRCIRERLSAKYASQLKRNGMRSRPVRVVCASKTMESIDQ